MHHCRKDREWSDAPRQDQGNLLTSPSHLLLGPHKQPVGILVPDGSTPLQRYYQLEQIYEFERLLTCNL